MRTCAVCRQARIEYQVFLDGLLRLANIPSLTFLSQGGAVAHVYDLHTVFLHTTPRLLILVEDLHRFLHRAAAPETGRRTRPGC
jgi:hypothetical protein